MIATLTAQRHIVLPPEVDARSPMAEGQRYHVLVSKEGVIMLRPKKEHKMSLREHLKGMQGLEIQRNRESIPAPVEL